MQLVALFQRHQLTSPVFLEVIREAEVQVSVNSLAALRYGSGGRSERKGYVGVTGSGAIRTIFRA